MARTQLHLEHLFRRGGFGASPGELAALGDMSMSQGISYLVNYEDQPDDVDSKIGQPELPQRGRARRSRRPTPSSRTRGSGGCSAWCTRSGRSRRRWRSSGTTTSPPPTARSPAPSAAVQATKMMALKDGRAAGPPRPAGDLPRLRARQLSRPADRGGQGPGDAGVAGRPPEHAAAPAGELRPRDHGALHLRHRQLHRRGRLRRGPRVHRLEPAAREPRRRRRELLRVPVHRQQPRHHARRRSRFAIYGERLEDHSCACGGRRHAGRRRLHHGAGHPPEDGRAPGAQAVALLRHRCVRSGSATSCAAPPASTWRTRRGSSR